MKTRAQTATSFGKKVLLLLALRKANGLTPGTEAELARAVGISSSAVYGWQKRGSNPRSDIGQRVAQVLEVDLAWLTDPRRPFEDNQPAVSLQTALSVIPPEEQAALARILSNPVERRAWLAHWNARGNRP